MKLSNATNKSFTRGPTYMNEDRPLQQRTKFGLLLGTKKLLLAWEFEKVNFDDSDGVLSVAGLPVLQATIEGVTLKLAWLSEKWGQWEELTADSKFVELIKTAEAKLVKAEAYSNKGTGKAKSA